MQATYAIYYIILDQKLGLIAAAMSLACWVGANAMVMNLGWSLAWKVGPTKIQHVDLKPFERNRALDNLLKRWLPNPFGSMSGPS